MLGWRPKERSPSLAPGPLVFTVDRSYFLPCSHRRPRRPASRRKQGRKRAPLFCRLRPSSPRRRCRCSRRRPACGLRSQSTCRHARCSSCTPPCCTISNLHNLWSLALTSCINMAKLHNRRYSPWAICTTRRRICSEATRCTRVESNHFPPTCCTLVFSGLVLASCRRACARAGICAAASDACFSDRATNAGAQRTGPCASGAGASPRVASSLSAGRAHEPRRRAGAIRVRRLLLEVRAHLEPSTSERAHTC